MITVKVREGKAAGVPINTQKSLVWKRKRCILGTYAQVCRCIGVYIQCYAFSPSPGTEFY